jgi:hypothetical protein
MPLRDHFRGETFKQASSEAVHAQWPATIVSQLYSLLPTGYQAEPRVRLGRDFEIDIGTMEQDSTSDVDYSASESSSGAATMLQAPPLPTYSVDADFADEYQYEVLIYDVNRARTLVAAIELVSPGNKDREPTREAFIDKCAVLIKQGVSVSMIDLVTNRQFNLYADLLKRLRRRNDPQVGTKPSSTYAVTCRIQFDGQRNHLNTWYHPLTIGQPLPRIPLWLNDEQRIEFDLEPSYEETYRVLRVK